MRVSAPNVVRVASLQDNGLFLDNASKIYVFHSIEASRNMLASNLNRLSANYAKIGGAYSDR